MILILDSNAAIEIILKREKGKILGKLIESAEKTVSSEFFRIETANVIRKYHQGNFLKKSECIKLLEIAKNLIDEFIPIKENHIEALNEAIRLKFSPYDMLYFTIARRMGGILVSLDRSLNLLAKKEGIETVNGGL